MRAWKSVGGSPTYFLYDGSHPICELDGSGNVLATNTWGGQLLSRRTGTGLAAASTFYTFDPSGNIAQRLDGAGNVLGAYAFDAFGLRTGTDATLDPYSGFGGQFGGYTDAETGLTLLSHRYYDTGTGRFVTRDPLGYAGGADLYAYCGNNPLSFIDPSGLAEVELRFKGEGWGPPYHGYIVLTDTNGTEYYFRGGPTVSGVGGSGSSASSGSSSQSSAGSSSSRSSAGGSCGSSNSSNSSNSSSAGSSRGGAGKNNGPWGPIHCDYGPYVSGTPDYTTASRSTKVLVNDNLPASYYYNLFKGRADQINNANIPYNPLSTNSNAAAGYILGGAGFKAPNPAPGWTPGLYHPLPLK